MYIKKIAKAARLLILLQAMILQYKYLQFFIGIIISVCIGCRAGRAVATPFKTESIKELRFLGEYIIPHNMQFQNTTIGGLSGIDYDREQDVYYLISDDWSQTNPARFYTARIIFSERGLDSVQFVSVTYFLQPAGTVYPGAKENPYRTPDPEALRYNPVRKNLIWTSEGERFINGDSLVLQDPAIRIIEKNGKYIDSFPLPPQTHMYAVQKGLRRNGVFEGASFADNYNNLYVSVEEPIYEDGPSAGTGDSSAWIRVLKYDVNKQSLLGEYAYKVDPVVRMPVPSHGHKINGVSEILEIGKNKILFVERSYSSGYTDCNIRVYIGDVSKATNIAAMLSLEKEDKFESIKKTLLLNMDLLGKYIGNIEGVSFGPLLPNGNRTFIFVADNNFRATNKTQFLLFEIIP